MNNKEFFNLYSHDFARVSVAIPYCRVADPAFNAKGDGPLTDGRLIYLFAVARFTVFAHTTMQNHPNTPTSTI